MISNSTSSCELKFNVQFTILEWKIYQLVTAISACGYGWYHYMLAIVCGWANASDAVEILCTSFLLPSAECDLELTTFRKGFIPIMGFIGMLIGGFLWGSLGMVVGGKYLTMLTKIFVCRRHLRPEDNINCGNVGQYGIWCCLQCQSGLSYFFGAQIY